MKKILVLVILAGLLVGAGTAYWRRSGATAVVLRTEAVCRGDLVVSISATGTVEPEEVIDVGAQVAGLILSFGQDANGKTVDYGSPVETGTVLATIDDALYTSDLTQAEAQVLTAKGGLQRAEADLEQAKAKLYQADRNWERAKQLGPSSALAGTDYDNYKTGYDTAKANMLSGEAAIVQAKGSLAQAESMLERAKRNLRYTTITSPVKGIIIDRRVNIGQTVVASLNAPSLFLIAKDLTRIQVWVAVNEADIGRLRTGQPVTFTVSAFPDETFKGQVGKIRLNASMTQNVVTYIVEVVADNPTGRLLPYLTADVKFELNRHNNVLMVPAAALTWTPTTEQVVPELRRVSERESAGESQEDRAGEAASQPASAPAGGLGHGVVWAPEGQYVRPIFVRVGLSNDLVTEVEGEGLEEGMKIVTGQEEGEAESGNTNPFLPKPPNRGKGGPPPPM
ncbi:MAG TPA: efflux RND transporter periplasmic adaptor subunit [Phycisphaerae bacterium]|nr:efflux RND transporter periplasmic adaptor subunit [Phycisphaerae bacterium]